MTQIDWTFEGQWPYQPQWFETKDGRMHYIDEGSPDQPAVVFVHGNPEWSFMFRHDIARLLQSGGVRVIAVDLLGFGRSDKPTNPSIYTVARHAERLALLLDGLDLRNVTLVGHDWGGPIGLAWAIQHPERIKSLCVINTIGHRPKGTVPLAPPIRVMRLPVLGELLVKGFNLFTKAFMFTFGVMHPLDAATKAAYLAPHPTWKTRSGVLAFPRQIPTGPTGPVADLLGIIETRLRQDFSSKPVWLIWGMKDIAFGPAVLAQWQEMFPHAHTLQLDEAGHFPEEDAPEQVAAAIADCVNA